MLAKQLGLGVLFLSSAIALQACAAPGAAQRDRRRDVDDEPAVEDGERESEQTPEEDDPAPPGMAPTGTSTCKGATPLVAFIGGSSIALRWSTLPGKSDGAKEYRVYRDGSNVGTVKPEFHSDFPEKNGKGFIDKNIVAGATYEYRVEAIDEKNAATNVGAPLCVVAPKELAPPPTIQLDYSKAKDLESVMLMGKAFLEIWYPKVAVALALPDYSPTASFRIRLDPSYTGVAYASIGALEIVINPEFLRKATQDMGMFLHERRTC